MPGPTRYTKSGKVKKKHPRVITSHGIRPLTKKEQRDPVHVGAPPSVRRAARIILAPPTRSDYGRTGAASPKPIDPAIVPNATTGLSRRDASDARLALSGSRETKSIIDVAPDLALKGAEVSSLFLGPEALGLKALATGAKLAKTAKVVKAAEEAAEDATKVSRAARAAGKVKTARKAAKVEREASKVERKAARTRIKTERSRMSPRERAADRAKSAKTRAQAKVYDNATKVVAGSGTGGAGAYGAREVGKKEGNKSTRVLNSLSAPAALPVAGTVPATTKAQRLATTPVELARATAEDPKAVFKGSINSARDSLTGFPAAIAKSATDPKGAVDMMIKDWEHRYGPLLKGNAAEFRKRVQTEGGLTPFAMDALIAAPPAGRAAGAIARTGKLGRRAEEFMTKERTAVMSSPGTVKTPKNAKSVQMRAGEAAADNIRKRLTKKRAERGEAVSMQAVKEGVNVPIRQRKFLRRGVATPKARGRQEMLAAQSKGGAEVTASGRAIKSTAAIINSVPRRHRPAIKWALALGVRTAEQARARLPKQIEMIRANRAPETQFGKLDNIPEIEQVIANADEIFTPDFGKKINDLRWIEKKIAVEDPKAGTGRRRDPALGLDQAVIRREAQQAEHLVGERLEGESQVDYMARARQARKEEGLAAPGYFPSELSRRQKKSQKGIGGSRFSEQTKAYKGKLFRQGIENNDPRLLVRAFDKNVKRRYAWDMVDGIMNNNALPWSRKADGQGKPLADQIKHMEATGTDPDSVVFLNPGLMRQMASNGFHDADGPALVGGETPEIGEAIQTAKSFQNAPEEFKRMSGWIGYPKVVTDELEASITSGAGTRLAGKAMSSMSKWMLAYNTGWATFQMASNGIQAALAGAGPLDMVRGQIIHRRLSDTERAKADAALGVTQNEQILDKPYMGSAMKGDGPIQGAVEAYQIFSEGKWARKMRTVNPISGFFKLAQIPENAVRRGVAHSVAKKVALERMGRNMNVAHRSMERVLHVMKMDPRKQVIEVYRHPELLDDVAKGLEDFMGDYTTFSSKERKWLKNVVPFYSWVRFATKFAFFTLPIKRPITTGILYQLGRLQTEEVRDILGNNIPWGLGKLFFDNGKFSIDAYRGNPVLSGITEFREPADVMGFLPPYLQLLTDQIYDRDYFTGQDLTVQGETSGRRFVSVPFEDRARILVNSLAGTFTPYRVASEVAYEGTPQSSDALPWDPRPKQYSSSQGLETVRRSEKAYRENGGAKGAILKNLAPFLPRPTDDLKSTAQYINAETAAEKARLRALHSQGGSSGSGGSGSTSDVIDRINDRISGNAPTQDVIDRIKERMGQ